MTTDDRRVLLRTGLVALAVVVLALAGVALAVRGGSQPAGPLGSAAVAPAATGPVPLSQRVAPTATAPLPAFELPAFHGNGTVRGTDYRGRPLVLNFWGSWCAPCVEEMPALQRVADALEGKLAVLGVDTADHHDDAVALVESLGIRYDLAIDERAELFTEVGGFGFPTTLLVDARGIIRYRHTGPLTADQLRALLARHLEVEGG